MGFYAIKFTQPLTHVELQPFVGHVVEVELTG